MKLEKKHWIIIAVIVLIIIIWYFSKKKKAESSYRRARNIGTSGQDGRGTSIQNHLSPSLVLSRDFDESGRVSLEDSAWWIFSKKPIQVTTPESTASKCVNCWVTSVEDGVQYCRWFDNNGRNTQSYAGRGCTSGQANMGGVNQGYGANYGKRKPWWASLFGI